MLADGRLFLGETSTHRLDLEYPRLRLVWVYLLWLRLIFRHGIARLLHPHGPFWLFPMDPLEGGLDPGKIKAKRIMGALSKMSVLSMVCIIHVKNILTFSEI